MAEPKEVNPLTDQEKIQKGIENLRKIQAKGRAEAAKRKAASEKGGIGGGAVLLVLALLLLGSKS